MRIIKELSVDDLAFSQNFVAFDDKLEKANHALVRALAAVVRRTIGRIRSADFDIAVREEICTTTMADVWRVLAIHLGTPPTQFTWQYRGKEEKFHAEGTMPPLQFAERFMPADLYDYVPLTNDPRKDNPEGRLHLARPHVVHGPLHPRDGSDKGPEARPRRHSSTGITHAMTLVGVGLVDSQPLRRRVENSWATRCAKRPSSPWTILGSTSTPSK